MISENEYSIGLKIIHDIEKKPASGRLPVSLFRQIREYRPNPRKRFYCLGRQVSVGDFPRAQGKASESGTWNEAGGGLAGGVICWVIRMIWTGRYRMNLPGFRWWLPNMPCGRRQVVGEGKRRGVVEWKAWIGSKR